MSTDIEQVSTALVEFDRVAAGLAVLEKQYAGAIYDVVTPTGMEFAKQARLTIRQPRYDIEKIRKAAKAPLLAIGKRLDSEAQRITMALLKLEEPIDEQIKNEEQREKREKEAREAADAARIAAIQVRLADLQRMPLRASGKSAAHACSVLVEAQNMALEGYDEFSATAAEYLQTSLIAVTGIVAEREAFEAEQVRIAAERVELEKLRAAQAERDAQARAAQAEQDRGAREALAAERAEAERVARIERERLAAERAEQERKNAAERAALDEQARQQRVEAERLAQAERERLAAQAPKPAPVTPPALTAMADVLAAHYSVNRQTVMGWLRSHFSEGWVQ